jgi:crotonobetainyl-CoA:carnitine CoA-transferase CaiB-like acyl-CoA transferase
MLADLDQPADLTLLRGLAAEADVVVENFRPGTLERRGLGYETVRAGNPGVVWCTISGFGAGSSRPGYDFVVQAESGWMAITGEPAGAPMKHGVALADVLAGKDAAVAILAALVARGRTGLGRRVETSLAASAEGALVNVAQNVLVTGQPARRWGNAHANLVPYQLFDAADRPIVVAVGSDGQWLACARALELEQLANDETLRTNAGRVAQRERIVSALSARLVGGTAETWRARLDAVGVPCGLVRSVEEVVAAAGGSPATGMPPSVPGVVRRPPPRLGEHDEMARARGWSAFK